MCRLLSLLGIILTHPLLLQKVIYLTIDMSLNSYFILTVKRRLVSYGVRIVQFIVWLCR